MSDTYDSQSSSHATAGTDKSAVFEQPTARKLGILLAVAAAIMAVVRFFKFLAGEEDRPPIRVRNPDIDFTTDKGWVDEDPHWKPDHKQGKKTDFFVVDFKSPGGYAPMIATEVEFHCDVPNGQSKITLSAKPHHGTNEPRLSPSGQLKKDPSNRKRLFVRDGTRLEKIVIQNPGKQDVPIDLTAHTGAIDILIYPKRN